MIYWRNVAKISPNKITNKSRRKLLLENVLREFLLLAFMSQLSYYLYFYFEFFPLDKELANLLNLADSEDFFESFVDDESARSA